jgi:protein farnesyltransferase subunit beta
MQNPDGGFAGGFGHTSHLATSYAAVLSLAIVGGEDAYECIDRRAMWRWLCSLKQPDGGFQMALGGEEDVRYVYTVPFHYAAPCIHFYNDMAAIKARTPIAIML